MTILNTTLVRNMNTLMPLAEKKLPIKLSFPIAQNLNAFQKAYETYEKALKQVYETFHEDMILDDDGNHRIAKNGIPMVNASAKDSFEQELADLLMQKVDVEIKPIDDAAFEYEDNDRYDVLTPAEIMQLQTILCN